MEDFIYTPDDDIPVHQEGAIKLICAPFQAHENGLPEWLKNSADAYVRENFDPKRRVIIIFLHLITELCKRGQANKREKR